MMKRTNQTLKRIMAAIMLIAAMIAPASATESIEEQMAANSAAWHIAKAAGDTATCDALHAANVALAEQAAGTNGNASYNEGNGTWDITTNDGGTISSSGSYDGGRSGTVTYTSTSYDGDISSTSGSAFTSSSIDAYMNNGGTHQGLVESYNNAAYAVGSTGNYGSVEQRTSGEAEAAVIQELYGLSDSEAARYQAEIEAAKQNYANAQSAYYAAVAAGDSAAAAAARAQMNAAHSAAEGTRAQYSFSGDANGFKDGGYITPKYDTGYSYYDGDDYYGSPSYDPYNPYTPYIPYNPYNPYDPYDPYDPYEPYYPSVPSSYCISASAGSGGAISPLGTTTVTRGGSQSYSITPNTGYKVSNVVVDGASKGAISSYTFSNVTSDHTISASFEKKTYTITASAGTGGSISPAGTIQVTHGESRSFSIIPDWGYKVKSVIVDGVDKGAVGGYSFSYINGNHIISVTFEPSGEIGLDDPVVTDDTGLETDGSGIKSGYGIFASVDVTYSGVTDVKLTMTYDFGFGVKTVVLEETGRFVFEYPVNSQSPLGKRCVYIPVETLDGTYTLTFTLTAKNVEGEVLTETSTATVVVRGNMYEDDFTGDS